MHVLRILTNPRKAGRLLILVVALLATQWIGTMHRVVHSGFQEDSGTLMHSCLGFDAAALGHAMLASPVVLPAVVARYETTQRIAFRSWWAPFFPCFSSRAPPTA